MLMCELASSTLSHEHKQAWGPHTHTPTHTHTPYHMPTPTPTPTVFNTNTQNKLAPCGTPSFPEENVMQGEIITGFKRTLQKLEWHNAQVMPNLKPSI